MNDDLKIVGITGGIASGKTLVSDKIQANGYKVIDTDIIARLIIDKNIEGALDKIVANFGAVVLENSDIDRDYIENIIKLDRSKLAKIIFNDSDARVRLNSIMHPIIKNIITDEVEQIKSSNYNKKIVFVIVPLLYEAGFESSVDEVIAVVTSVEKQLERLQARDEIDKKYALAKIKTQLSMKNKAKKADYVIDNSGSKKETYKQLQHIIFNLEQTMIV